MARVRVFHVPSLNNNGSGLMLRSSGVSYWQMDDTRWEETHDALLNTLSAVLRWPPLVVSNIYVSQLTTLQKFKFYL